MKKYLMMLSALLMMGAASVTMTSCGDDDDDDKAPGTEQGGEAKVPTTVAEAEQMLLGQWEFPQAFVDWQVKQGWYGPADQFGIEYRGDGWWGFFRHYPESLSGEDAEYAGKYVGTYQVFSESTETEYGTGPDAEAPTSGKIFFGMVPVQYRNLTSESVEVYLSHVDEDGEVFSGIVGWHKLTKVKTYIEGIEWGRGS